MKTAITNYYTAIYAGGGNFLTENISTNFHHFYKSKMLTADESINDYKEVTEPEKIALETADTAWIAPPRAFIDQWNEACGEYGTYNHDTGFFELNGLKDITYAQALEIMTAGKPTYNGGNASRYYQTKIRTNLPLLENAYSGVATGMKMFAWSWSLESVNAAKLTVSTFFFELSSKIHTIIGPFYCLSASPAGCFSSCSSLRKMQMVIGSGLIVLKDSPLINLESWNYIIEHKQNPTTNISTIQVHPNVYAKLTGDTSNAAAAALTEEELAQWMALTETAASNNITFTTS